MAKRTNPFVDDFVQQSKIHVGIKQFNNNEARIKNVYEKTLQLLYKGAKKSRPQDIITFSDQTNRRNDGMKQLFIGRDGTLLHSGTMVKDKEPVLQKCPCGSLATDIKCGYCEKGLCGECQHVCATCRTTYCSQCSLVGLDGLEMCVSCYS